MLLEATPKGIDLDDVRSHILEADGVEGRPRPARLDDHLRGERRVGPCHRSSPGADGAAVLDELCRCLSGDFDIEHSTFQLETADRRRLEEAGHA